METLQAKVKHRQKPNTGGCGTYCIANFLNLEPGSVDETIAPTTIYEDTETLQAEGGGFFHEAYWDQVIAIPSGWGRVPKGAGDLFQGREAVNGPQYDNMFRAMLLTVLPVGQRKLHRVLLICHLREDKVWVVDSLRERVWQAMAEKMLEKYQVQGVAVLRTTTASPMAELMVYREQIEHIIGGAGLVVQGGVV